MTAFKCPPEVPKWLLTLPKDRLLNVRDVAAIFGIKQTSVSMCSSGAFIPADVKIVNTFGRNSSRNGGIRLQWKVGTIIKEIKRRQLANEK
ncbi:MAG: hypothetical protein ACK5X3_09355 [Pseudomonadota bacterium]|jgi:hypothetical protein